MNGIDIIVKKCNLFERLAGRMIDLDDLVDVPEIVKRLELKRNQVVYNWIKSPAAKFPQPIKILHGPVFFFYWPDIVLWISDRNSNHPNVIRKQFRVALDEEKDSNTKE